MTNRLLQIEENDPKAFWRIINDMRNFGAGTKDASENVKPSNWFHFLCECPMYDDLRKLYFNFDSTNPPIDRTVLFKQVLTNDSAENTRVLGKFLTEAFLRRKSEMDIPQTHSTSQRHYDANNTKLGIPCSV